MILRGIGANAGAAIAKLHFLKPVDLTVVQKNDCDPALELTRYKAATVQAQAELGALHARAMEKDPETAAVFEVHQMMLEDLDYTESVEGMIAQGCSAEWAVEQTERQFHAMFEAMEDEYFRARAADVTDVSHRLIRILKGVADENVQFTERVIVAAEDLLPSQTVKLDRSYVAGFVTQRGSSTSHSVILARTMGIPCVVGMGAAFGSIPEQGRIAIDGATGEVCPSPNAAEEADFKARIAAWNQQQALLEQYRGKPAVTKGGKRMLVCANIGSPQDAQLALQSDAEGVGLFRSEFLYLEGTDFPSEESQFDAYRTVLSMLSPRPIVIRTLDFGSDKQAPYFDIGQEENPALGYRAIRICLERQDIFRTQLRALLRASVYGKLRVMFPMISHVSQVLQIKEILASVQSELKAEGIAFSKDVQFGIMVETPAAVLMSDELAQEVDFFSIGTNDLTQYTLAVDRGNARISHLFDSANPAVLRAIEMTARNAHKHGIWVGICGESAANTALTAFYASIGIDELSVAPSSVLSVKRAVSECE